MTSFKELREQISEERVLEILAQYGEYPAYNKEGVGYIIFNTCCHNLSGGSPKLYYYKNTHMFKCYTECNSMFDIFELIIKMEALRGKRIGKYQAIQLTGLELTSHDLDDLANESILSDLSRIYEINNTEVCDIENLDLTPIDMNAFEDRFLFDFNGLKSWIEEGIGWNSMLKYRIAYDPIDNCIIIPHYDDKGNVVGIRGRYLNADAVAKYKPITYNCQLLNHPKNKTLYGYYQNLNAIKMTRSCIIFESEKSVLMLDTVLDNRNVSVAVCGQVISREHIQLLLAANVNNVVVAFDADYKNNKERNEKFKEYKSIAKPLTVYFNVSIIMDCSGLLGYKDSPIDKGIEVFNQLMKERVRI